MIEGTLAADNAIDGAQLCDEIQAALGIDVRRAYMFFAPRTVQVAGHDDQAAAIQSLIAAHVPTPGYIPLTEQAAALQRATDAATLLNAPAVRDTQAHRDAFARLIGVQPLTIPLTQDATAADIQPLSQ